MTTKKTALPQLRVRTEYSFRNTFGPVPLVAKALAEIGAPSAAMVDGSTWGHVSWAKEMKKAGVRPMFGMEFPVPQEDGRKPVAWAIAKDTRAFYRLTSALQQPDADPGALLAAARGVIRFAGAALTDPEQFDYIDLNPASQLQWTRAMALHERTKKPLVITSDNWFPTWQDHRAFLAIGGRERSSPQFLLREDELRKALPFLTARKFNAAVKNTHEVAEMAAGALPQASIIQVTGDLRALAEEGRKKRLRLGHLASWPKAYAARLQHELAAIEAKGYQSYFLVVAELISWAKERMLVGPGRGSSAGSLLCYLIGITEVDPIEHGLLFERFIDVTREDLPDIDIDFSDAKRELCFEHLRDLYGADKVARIGSINNLRARSVIARVCEKLAIPDRDKFDVMNVLIEYSSGDSRYGHALEDTMEQTEPGRRFMEAHPEAAVMFQLENHASHTGVHAAGVIVCNEPVSEFCTVGADGVIQGDKKYAEAVNLLKIDALGLRTLGLIEDAGCVTGDELFALKLDDPKVFALLNAGKYAGVFQFEGQAQRRVASEVNITSFRQMDHITALARPGPLGGGASQHYISRAAGREDITYRHASMADYLGATMGVVLYQEQVMRIVREIGQFTWAETTEIRKAMSGRKGKEYFDQRGDEFVAGAKKIKMSEADARAIWSEICTFGAWGMNASHTTSYSVISYWCAWMKVYHPLEYAASCLRHAKDDAQAYEILREWRAEGIEHIAFDPDISAIDWAAVDGKLVGGFMNLVGFGPAKSAAAIEARAQGKLDREKIAKAEVKFSELFPINTAYAAWYADPEAHGCRAGSRIAHMNEIPEEGEVLLIAKVLRKELRDKNEDLLVARRNGQRVEGQSLFLDIFITDDTGIPMTLRVSPRDYFRIGQRAAEILQPEDVLLIRARRIPNFAMLHAKRLRLLNREEVIDA